MAFNFRASLGQGQIGELIWYEAQGGAVTKLDGRKSDFTSNSCGSGIELKSDMWDMKKTPNFFFERYSDEAKQTPGGPWQAILSGSKQFVYFYVKNFTYFKFDTEKLIERLETIIPSLEPFAVENKSWTTIGYRVPRESVLDLATEYEIKMSAKEKCNNDSND